MGQRRPGCGASKGFFKAGGAARRSSKASVVRKHGGGNPELAENVAYMQCIRQRMPEMEVKEWVMPYHVV